MDKPTTVGGYSDRNTIGCERLLVTLLRGLGPWKESVYLIGGLTPRYLVDEARSGVPPHAGTLDVDLVIDLEVLTVTQAYSTLEANLRKMGFRRAQNTSGQKLSWRWQTFTEHGTRMVLELLADAPQIAGGKVQPLPTRGAISALNIPYSSIVHEMHEVREIQAELLDGNGIAVEPVKHADLVSFTCLKALAFDQRFERKDAYDLIYCIEHGPEGLEAVSASFHRARNGTHGDVIGRCLDILRNRFARDASTEGHLKDGPVAVAKFELGDGEEPELREARALRQRHASEVIEQLLAKIG